MTCSAAPCRAEPGLQPLRQLLPRAYLEADRPAAIPGVRWDAIHRSTFPYIETPQYTRRIARGMALPRSLAARLRTLVPDDEELGTLFGREGNYTLMNGRPHSAGKTIAFRDGAPVQMVDPVERREAHGMFGELGSSGVFGRASGPPGSGVPGDNFNQPTDVAWDAAGNIFVSDGYGNSRVHKFAPNGTLRQRDWKNGTWRSGSAIKRSHGVLPSVPRVE